MKISKIAEYILDTLSEYGYEAYIVGGCVRDLLLGEEPNDWDITTDARTDDIKRVFSNIKVLDTGIKHGTVTLVIGDGSFEVTTYRTEGNYVMNRKPEKVTFVKSLKEDLKRRDFTINAMAYNPADGLIDYFGGEQDLKLRVIRCVGDANERLSEDALRIMRALRFASEKNFKIESQTYMAMCKNLVLLKNISAERILGELNKVLMGKGVYNALKLYSEPIFEIIPELGDLAGFDNTIRSIKNSEANLEIRIALLFYKRLNPEISKNVMKRLKYDSITIKNVINLLENIDVELIASEKLLIRQLSKYGEEFFIKLLKVKMAKVAGYCAEKCGEEVILIEKVQDMIKNIIESRKCYSLETLAINGNDLKERGIPEGKLLGKILEDTLCMVMDGSVENQRDYILKKLENEGILKL